MKHYLLLLLLAFAHTLCAQKKNEAFQYHIHKTDLPIRIDGIADEAAWQTAQLASDFFMVLPMDTSRANVRTEVRMCYDMRNLYVYVHNYEKLPGSYIVESLRRDFSFGKNDNFLLFMDPFDDQTNGFTFGANAMGAQWDGLMFDGGRVDLSWDNKWESAVQTHDDYWTVEMSIPFKTLRYKPGITRWGINFSRLDMKTTEKSSWTPIPRQFPTASLAYTGVLVWDSPPPAAGANISIIPYTLGGLGKDYNNGSKADNRFDAGLDAKIGVTSSLNLDLTLNPDFSQVEVDRQQINLDQFELFFPERRQFFLENADLFSNFGYSNLRPFFSRRIGLNTPIIAGARLSGKLSENWRISAMNMQTDETDATPAQNFGVFALQRRVFARSNINALFINKQTLRLDERAEGHGLYDFNRNLGLEYNLASPNNVWTGKAMLLRSFAPDEAGSGTALAGNLLYNAREWTLGASYQYIDKQYRAEVGFVPRTGLQRINPTVGHLFFPKQSKVLSHGPLFEGFYLFDPTFKAIENTQVLIYRINFLNRSDLSLWTARDYVILQGPFDPTNFVGDTLATGSTHDWQSFGFDYLSKPQSLFTWALSGRYGGYYASGTRLRLGGEMGYRFQPYLALTLSANYNGIDFNADERLPLALQNQSYDFWLIGPRIDLTLTNKLYLTNFVQYNNQLNNLNLNFRLQWRYRPASDLFLVYTDNYFTENFRVRNRAIVLKVAFWWNG